MDTNVMIQTLQLHIDNDPYEDLDKVEIVKLLLMIFVDETKRLGRPTNFQSREEVLALTKHSVLMKAFLYYLEKECDLPFSEVTILINKLFYQDCMCNECQAKNRNLN